MIHYLCRDCDHVFAEDAEELEVECAWCGSTNVEVTV